MPLSPAGANPAPSTAPAAGYSDTPAAGYDSGPPGAYPGPGDAYGSYGQVPHAALQQVAAAPQGYNFPPAAQQQAPEYGQQQQAGYGGGNLMDAVTAPQVGRGGDSFRRRRAGNATATAVPHLAPDCRHASTLLQAAQQAQSGSPWQVHYTGGVGQGAMQDGLLPRGVPAACVCQC